MPTPAWSEDRVAVLKQMANDGRSAREIAAAVHAPSRNAVLGKAFRLGLKLSGAPAPRPVTKVRRPAAPLRPGQKRRGRPPKAATATKPVTPPAQPKEPVVFYSAEPPDKPESLQLQLVELTDRMCKWAEGDIGTPEFSFCGHATYDRLPYCEHHARRALSSVLVRAQRGSV